MSFLIGYLKSEKRLRNAIFWRKIKNNRCIYKKKRSADNIRHSLNFTKIDSMRVIIPMFDILITRYYACRNNYATHNTRKNTNKKQQHR